MNNVYLLFALAFGTLTGVTDARVPREAVSVVRAEKRAPLVARRSPVRRSRTTALGSPDSGAPRSSAGVRTSASPRAPAVSC